MWLYNDETVSHVHFKGYDSDTITLQKYQLFDLKVKGERQNVIMLVHDTPSHDYTPTSS
jgi:hypothetical protein